MNNQFQKGEDESQRTLEKVREAWKNKFKEKKENEITEKKVINEKDYLNDDEDYNNFLRKMENKNWGDDSEEDYLSEPKKQMIKLSESLSKDMVIDDNNNQDFIKIKDEKMMKSIENFIKLSPYDEIDFKDNKEEDLWLPIITMKNMMKFYNHDTGKMVSFEKNTEKYYKFFVVDLGDQIKIELEGIKTFIFVKKDSPSHFIRHEIFNYLLTGVKSDVPIHSDLLNRVLTPDNVLSKTKAIKEGLFKGKNPGLIYESKTSLDSGNLRNMVQEPFTRYGHLVDQELSNSNTHYKIVVIGTTRENIISNLPINPVLAHYIAMASNTAFSMEDYLKSMIKDCVVSEEEVKYFLNSAFSFLNEDDKMGIISRRLRHIWSLQSKEINTTNFVDKASSILFDHLPQEKKVYDIEKSFIEKNKELDHRLKPSRSLFHVPMITKVDNPVTGLFLKTIKSEEHKTLCKIWNSRLLVSGELISDKISDMSELKKKSLICFKVDLTKEDKLYLSKNGLSKYFQQDTEVIDYLNDKQKFLNKDFDVSYIDEFLNTGFLDLLRESISKKRIYYHSLYTKDQGEVYSKMRRTILYECLEIIDFLMQEVCVSLKTPTNNNEFIRRNFPNLGIEMIIRNSHLLDKNTMVSFGSNSMITGDPYPKVVLESEGKNFFCTKFFAYDMSKKIHYVSILEKINSALITFLEVDMQNVRNFSVDSVLNNDYVRRNLALSSLIMLNGMEKISAQLTLVRYIGMEKLVSGDLNKMANKLDYYIRKPLHMWLIKRFIKFTKTKECTIVGRNIIDYQSFFFDDLYLNNLDKVVQEFYMGHLHQKERTKTISLVIKTLDKIISEEIIMPDGYYKEFLDLLLGDVSLDDTTLFSVKDKEDLKINFSYLDKKNLISGPGYIKEISDYRHNNPMSSYEEEDKFLSMTIENYLSLEKLNLLMSKEVVDKESKGFDVMGYIGFCKKGSILRSHEFSNSYQKCMAMMVRSYLNGKMGYNNFIEQKVREIMGVDITYFSRMKSSSLDLEMFIEDVRSDKVNFKNKTDSEIWSELSDHNGRTKYNFNLVKLAIAGIIDFRPYCSMDKLISSVESKDYFYETILKNHEKISGSPGSGHIKQEFRNAEKLKDQKLHTLLHVLQFFTKEQLGSFREIYIMSILPMMVINFIEQICRCICEIFPGEMLTKGTGKHLIPNYHETNTGLKRDNYGPMNYMEINYFGSLDCTTWCQRFTPLSMGNFLHHMFSDWPSLNNLISRIQNMHANKLIAIPPSIIKKLLKHYNLNSHLDVNNKREFSLSSKNSQELYNYFEDFMKNRLVNPSYENILFKEMHLLKNRSNFCQGVYHFTSSLMNASNSLLFCNIISSWYKKIFKEGDIITSFQVSSDDIGILITLIGPKEFMKMNENLLYNFLYMCQEKLYISCNLFTAKVSEEKSTWSFNKLYEFNSEFMLDLDIAKVLIKNAYSIFNLPVTDTFRQGFDQVMNVVRNLFERGMSNTMCYEILTMCKFQHYRTLGLGHMVNSSYFNQLEDLQLSSLGFFHIPPNYFTGFFPYSFSEYKKYKEDQSFRAVTNSCYKMIDNNVSEEGIPEINITFSPSKESIKDKQIKKALRAFPNFEDIFNNEPTLYLRDPNSKEECLAKICDSMAYSSNSISEFGNRKIILRYMYFPYIIDNAIFSFKRELKKFSLREIIYEFSSLSRKPSDEDFSSILFKNETTYSYLLNYFEENKISLLPNTSERKRLYYHKITLETKTYSMDYKMKDLMVKYWNDVSLNNKEEIVMSDIKKRFPWVKRKPIDSVTNSPFSTIRSMMMFVNQFVNKKSKIICRVPKPTVTGFGTEILEILRNTFAHGFTLKYYKSHDDNDTIMPSSVRIDKSISFGDLIENSTKLLSDCFRIGNMIFYSEEERQEILNDYINEFLRKNSENLSKLDKNKLDLLLLVDKNIFRFIMSLYIYFCDQNKTYVKSQDALSDILTMEDTQIEIFTVPQKLMKITKGVMGVNQESKWIGEGQLFVGNYHFLCNVDMMGSTCSKISMNINPNDFDQDIYKGLYNKLSKKYQLNSIIDKNYFRDQKQFLTRDPFFLTHQGVTHFNMIFSQPYKFFDKNLINMKNPVYKIDFSRSIAIPLLRDVGFKIYPKYNSFSFNMNTNNYPRLSENLRDKPLIKFYVPKTISKPRYKNVDIDVKSFLKNFDKIWVESYQIPDDIMMVALYTLKKIETITKDFTDKSNLKSHDPLMTEIVEEVKLYKLRKIYLGLMKVFDLFLVNSNLEEDTTKFGKIMESERKKGFKRFLNEMNNLNISDMTSSDDVITMSNYMTNLKPDPMSKKKMIMTDSVYYDNDLLMSTSLNNEKLSLNIKQISENVYSNYVVSEYLSKIGLDLKGNMVIKSVNGRVLVGEKKSSLTIAMKVFIYFMNIKDERSDMRKVRNKSDYRLHRLMINDMEQNDDKVNKISLEIEEEDKLSITDNRRNKLEEIDEEIKNKEVSFTLEDLGFDKLIKEVREEEKSEINIVKFNFPEIDLSDFGELIEEGENFENEKEDISYDDVPSSDDISDSN